MEKAFLFLLTIFSAQSLNAGQATELNNLHLLVVAAERPKCSECNKTFSKKGNLKTHMKKHKGITFACTHPGCKQTYAQENSLTRHMKEHESTTFACTHSGCSSAFTNTYHLTRHVNSLHEGITFACTHPGCSSVFTDNSNLARHMKKHAGITFACTHPGCTKKYTEQGSLTKHMKKHADITFACTHPGCTKKYTEQGSLTKHKKNKHKEDIPTSGGAAASAAPAQPNEHQDLSAQWIPESWLTEEPDLDNFMGLFNFTNLGG